MISYGNATKECVSYVVATVSRIDKITGFFCRILSLLYGSFAKETYNLIDFANRSHPMIVLSFAFL